MGGVPGRGWAVLVGAAALLAGAASADVLDPVVVRSRVMLARIYDAGSWAKRIPYELAAPILIRAKLGDHVDELDLPDDTRERVKARIAAEDFVDELVPFLLALKEVYVPPEGVAPEGFDAWLRRHFRPGEGLPGMEHSMFRWEPAAAAGSGELPPGLARDVASRLVRLYDALYLRGRPRVEGVEQRLACETRSLGSGLREAAGVAQPAVRDLLETALARLEAGSEFAAAVRATLVDASRLEAITAALVLFIDQMACKHYRAFAARVGREAQLRSWLLAELARPGGGDLWSFLEHAQDERRHAVLIVVDGLQGHLVEALADGSADQPFVRAARAEQDAGPSLRPATQRSEPAPPQQTRFLEALSERGFRHPRYLAFFRRLYEQESATIARGGIASTPTISVRNLPIAKTGAAVAGPGGTGIPNFHFVDRGYVRGGVQQGRPYYFFGNDAVLLPSLAREAGMRTLHERLPEHTSMSCMAQYDDAAQFVIDALLNLALGEKQRDFGERLCFAALERRVEHELELRLLRAELLADREELTAPLPWYALLDRMERRDLRELARRDLRRVAALEAETLPELLIYYNPWPDHFAHFTGPWADEIVSPSGELNRLDHWLGRLDALYRRAGVEGRTLFAMSGDHGLAPVFHLLNPEVEVFDRLREEGVDFRVVKISSDEGEGPKLTNPFEPPSLRGVDVVVASTAGGNYMLDLFHAEDARWAEQPVHEDLRTLTPRSRRNDIEGNDAPGPEGGRAATVDLIAALHDRLDESLDYLAVREGPCGAEGGEVRLVGPRRGRRADAWIRRRGDRIHYRFRRADLLETDRLTPYRRVGAEERARHAALRERCLGADRARGETWCTESEWRALTASTPRPDSVVQLAHLYDSERAGTVNLFPRAGIGYNSRVPGRHAGELFHEKDAFVGAWGGALAAARGRERLPAAVNGSLPMLVYEYLSGRAAAPGRDGWGHPRLALPLGPGREP